MLHPANRPHSNSFELSCVAAGLSRCSFFQHHKPRISTPRSAPCTGVLSRHAFFWNESGKLAILWKFLASKISPDSPFAPLFSIVLVPSYRPLPHGFCISWPIVPCTCYSYTHPSFEEVLPCQAQNAV